MPFKKWRGATCFFDPWPCFFDPQPVFLTPGPVCLTPGPVCLTPGPVCLTPGHVCLAPDSLVLAIGFVFLAAAPLAFKAGGRGKTFGVWKPCASASWLVAILWRCAAVWLRVFGNCAGCAKLIRAGRQNLNSDSETKRVTIRLGRVFLVVAPPPPTLRAKAAKAVQYALHTFCFWQSPDQKIPPPFLVSQSFFVQAVFRSQPRLSVFYA